MNEDKEEDEDEDENEEEDSLLTSKEPFRMNSKLILAVFTVFEKVVTDGEMDRRTDGQTDRLLY